MNQEQALATDKEDLLGLLSLRFGSIPETAIQSIEQTSDLNTIERLIVVAANVPDLNTFLAELDAGSTAFKIVGDVYNPIPSPKKGV